MKHLFVLAIWLGAGLAASLAEELLPDPRVLVKTERLLGWSFTENTAGWTAQHDCTLAVGGGALRIQSTGNDPYLAAPPFSLAGPLRARLRVRGATGGAGQLFWTTTQAPDTAEARSRFFKLIHDGQWHQYEVDLPAEVAEDRRITEKYKKQFSEIPCSFNGAV